MILVGVLHDQALINAVGNQSVAASRRDVCHSNSLHLHTHTHRSEWDKMLLPHACQDLSIIRLS